MPIFLSLLFSCVYSIDIYCYATCICIVTIIYIYIYVCYLYTARLSITYVSRTSMGHFFIGGLLSIGSFSRHWVLWSHRWSDWQLSGDWVGFSWGSDDAISNWADRSSRLVAVRHATHHSMLSIIILHADVASHINI